MGRGPQDAHDIHGILLLDKPPGRSSNQALQDVKRLFRAKKAGHTGSLDPFATGMLPVCFGEATKTAGFMLDADKVYRATARFGHATSTGDTEGDVVLEEPVPALSEEDIRTVMAGFLDVIEQVPPMYSALKHEGQPLYKLAREGREVERKPREVTIHALKLLRWDSPDLTFEVECSKGTYVRTLAEDLAKALGTCAHLIELRRHSVTPFDAGDMHTMETLSGAREAGTLQDLLLAVDAGLQGWSRVEISEGQAARFCHGNPVIIDGQAPGMVRVYSHDGTLLGLGETKSDNQTYPKRIFLFD